MIAFYGAACALGAAAGAAFAWLWLRLVPPGTNRRFWSSMSELARRLLAVEETREFLLLYRRLGALLARYVGRNLGATVVACLPMIAILLTVAPLVFGAWDRTAERVALVPPAASAIVPATTTAERTGYCASEGYCALFAALDFKVVRLDAGPEAPAYVVARADHGDVNPLWPFLSDIEAAFFAVFILATLIGLLWPRKPRS
ncbi:MAG TPA: hypothetical protein VGX52_08810 [Burkholderiales bacterium]|nr:hypothetical protein [Burkholderiales bacterium]